MNLPTTRARRVVAAGAAVALGAVAALGQAPAQAAEPTETLAEGLLSPLSAAVTDDGTVYYSQNFAGGLFALGEEAPVYQTSQEGAEIGALSADGNDVVFVEGFTMKRLSDGTVTELADLEAYEQENNPDAAVKYGFKKLNKKCVKKIPRRFPAKYTGIVESHPYGSTVDGETVYVADAAANAILAINGTEVSTVAVLPSVKVTATKRLAKSANLPDCVVGKTYRFENVPTDVEVGPDGLLYVTSLPGGEIPGAGSLMTVDPATGAVDSIAGGFTGATGVAVDDNGDVYVAELMANAITKIPAGGSPEPFYTGQGAPGPAALEIDGDTLYATLGALTGLSGEPNDVPAGSLVTFDLGNPGNN